MKQLKIIIADDNKDVVELYKGHIEKNSEFRILDMAFSSKEELEMIEKYNPDIVITDIIRKGEEVSGLDIILDYEKNKSITKFILITATDKQEVFWKCGYRMPSNIISFLRKPINWDSLIDELKKAEIEINSEKMLV